METIAAIIPCSQLRDLCREADQKSFKTVKVIKLRFVLCQHLQE